MLKSHCVIWCKLIERLLQLGISRKLAFQLLQVFAGGQMVRTIEAVSSIWSKNV